MMKMNKYTIIGQKSSKTIRNKTRGIKEFPTPIDLIKTLKRFETFDKNNEIFDPCCGKGNIIKFFESKSFKTIGSDINTKEYQKKDIFKYNGTIANVISNPPYNSKIPMIEFIKKFIELSINKTCIILNTNIFSNRKFQEILKNGYNGFRCSKIICLRGNQVFGDCKGYMYNWFVFRKGFKGNIKYCFDNSVSRGRFIPRSRKSKDYNFEVESEYSNILKEIGYDEVKYLPRSQIKQDTEGAIISESRLLNSARVGYIQGRIKQVIIYPFKQSQNKSCIGLILGKSNRIETRVY